MSMEQREGAAAPVVRQLDFTVNFMAAADVNANAKVNSLLPDQPQYKWLAAGNSQHANGGPQSPSRAVAQTKLLPRKMVMPPRSPYKELPQMEGQAKSPLIAPRLVLPVGVPVTLPKRALQPLIKTESPKSRERNIEQNDGTPKKQKQCRCKNSKCLKLYCECFANGVYCDGCNCINCHNTIENEADRKEAIDAVLERKPDAFYGVEQNRGCNCKRTGCLKKYCECFQANVPCSDKCKCIDCKNFEGSEERKLRLYQHSADSVAFIQQANAAINGALGTPSTKSRNQQIGFDVASNRQFTNWIPESHQETYFTSGALYSPSAVQLSKPDPPTKLGLSKSSYRSPLSGILQLEHVKDFCKLLVEVSAEAAKSLSEERKMINNGIDVNRAETSNGYREDSKDHQSQQNVVEFPENKTNSERTSLCESDGCDIQNGRPLSPGTLALMCDERDATFMTADAPSTVTESNMTNSKSAATLGPNELYVEQEMLVLTRLRCFLNRLITCGSIEETRVEQGNP